MADSVRKLIYEQMWSILSDDSTFTYIKTRQRGYVPTSPDLLSSTMFPWAFIEFDNISEISVNRMPLNFKMDYSLSLVVMTYADKMGVAGLVYNSDSINTNKGIGDMIDDILNVFHGKWKQPRFGVVGVIDWRILGVNSPNVPGIMRLTTFNELIRAKQIDFGFTIEDRQ